MVADKFFVAESGPSVACYISRCLCSVHTAEVLYIYEGTKHQGKYMHRGCTV